MNQADKLISVEKAEVGYREGFSGGHYDNHQKYSPAVPGLEWSQNQAWCQTFQSWAFQQAALRSLAPVTASCATGVGWYRSRSRFSYYPAIGAMVFFGSGGGGHVGLVYRYDADNAYTIEGNTNANGSPEGNGVYLKTRPRRDRFLYGYGLPLFTEGVVTADPGLRDKEGFTYRTTASAGVSAPSPVAPAEAALPWVSADQLALAATPDGNGERVSDPSQSDPADGVGLVQDALEAVMGVLPGGRHGVFDGETQELFDRFRKERLGLDGADDGSPPDTRSLVGLAEKSRSFNVRAGASPVFALPWISVNQVMWASTHSPQEQEGQPGGTASAKADVTLVQTGLEKVMHTVVTDLPGIFDQATQSLYDEFRRTVLHYSGDDAIGTPGERSLTELGQRSGLFQVRSVPVPTGGTSGAVSASERIEPKEVAFDRYSADGALEDWIAQACTAAGVPANRQWIGGFKTAAPRESSGNPNACNLWDTNAITPHGYSKVRDYGDGYRLNEPVRRINGTLTPFQCSRGVVQCIPQTFARYHAAGTSVNIYDPVASIASSIRYVRDRYHVAADGSNLASKVQQFDPNRPPKGY